MNTAASPVSMMLNKMILHLVLLAAAAIVLFPVFYVFMASFKSTQELLRGGVNMFPEQFTFTNYALAWKAANFSKYMLNSFIYAGTVTVITSIFATMSGYCLQRRVFPGRKFILGSYYLSMFVAGAVTIYPIFLIIVKAGLHKSLLGLILATLGGSPIFGTLLVIGFLNGVPKELDESAIMDGCGVFKIYTHIIFPIIKPVIGVVAMITFQGTWNSYMLPLALTLTQPNNRPLSVGVTTLAYLAEGQGGAKWDLLLAGTCMAIIPITIVFLLANRYFVGGMTSGAIKG
ncbi:carbohydrate ABC transporter permease [Paenibacillus silviterrae]|uniref:carbohydrate ABC transporter permease n=1 Tax=Paenibacillus silviterrae TaxID=3242194 RepID=UPI002543E131|nr:carbohydrate ABC transporter permease [Paenibacillus chinjuensis]